jgi:phosphoserine phosphatase
VKLAVFDFDSTLMDGETIDFLAKSLGLEERVAEITKRAMAGELDFFESLVERVSLLKGLSVDEVNSICASLPMMNGSKEVVTELKQNGYKVICFSGGFRNATTPACKALGIDADFSNILHHEDGVLTGRVGGDMMFGFSKGDMIVRLQNLLGVSEDNTLVVGDGANDLSMFKHASTRVAFGANEILKKEATHIVDSGDLRDVLGCI